MNNYPDERNASVIFIEIKRKYGQAVLQKARRYVSKNATVEKEFSHLRFNHECKRNTNNVLPKSLRFRPPIKIREGFKLARKMGWKFLQLRISDSHRKINVCKREIFELGNKLEDLLTSTEWNNLSLYARQKSRLIQTKSEEVQREKLNHLLSSLPAKQNDSVQKSGSKIHRIVTSLMIRLRC